MRGQQLDKIEAEAVGTFCGFGVRVANADEPRFVECPRDGPVLIERDRRWCHGFPRTGVAAKRPATLPWDLGRSLAAGMRELDAERGGAPAAAHSDNASQRRRVRIGIK